MSFELVFAFFLMVCAMVGISLMIVGAPAWYFLVLGCVGVVVIALLLYVELNYIDALYSFSLTPEKEKLPNQRRRKHRRNIFILVTCIILICLFLGWGFAAHYFTAIK